MKKYSTVTFFAIMQIMYIILTIKTVILTYNNARAFVFLAIFVMGLGFNSNCLYTEIKKIIN